MDEKYLKPEPLKRLTRDLRSASVTLSKVEVRYLVDCYYQIQENRIRADGQVRSMAEEPHTVLLWLAEQNRTLENQIKAALDKFSAADPVGKWMRAQKGIGPVIAAGMLAHFDVSKSETAGGFWRFAGLDPTCEWKKGEKRPWNGRLKVICVHPDTYITTKRGHVPIKDVLVGDVVLTHKGRWRKVTKTFINPHDGELYGLRGVYAGNQIAWLTAGHPVWSASVETNKNGRTHYIKEKTRAPYDWHAVENIQPRWNLCRPVIDTGDALIPDVTLEGIDVGNGMVAAEGFYAWHAHPNATRIKKTFPLDPDFMRLLGLFVSEGNISRTRAYWSFHEDETELHRFVTEQVRRLTGKNPLRLHNLKCRSMQFSIGCKPLADWISKTLGTNSHDMLFPMDWLSLPDELLKPFWQGIMEGDGDHVGQDKGRRVSTCSKALALQYVDLARRLGFNASCHSEKSGKAFRVRVNDRCDREVGARDTLVIDYRGPVYNIEVEEDNSYVAAGYAVHNCWKAGQSFVKVSGRENAYYGHLYTQRKEQEVRKNEAGEFAAQAALALEKKNYSKDTDAYKAYITGKLPPAHVHARACRYAVHIFVSHLHHKMYVNYFGKEPPAPFPIAIQGHAHYLAPPGHERKK